MTSDAAQPLALEEVRALADQLTTWAGTLSARQRGALGEVLQRAATTPPGNDPAPGPQHRLLTTATYDALFVRLQETAPDLTIPDA